MDIKILLALIEECIQCANRASNNCKSYEDCAYALGVHEGCMNNIENYVKQFKEGNNAEHLRKGPGSSKRSAKRL